MTRVIEISEETYNLIKNKELLSNDDYKVEIWEAINNSKSLDEYNSEKDISVLKQIKDELDHESLLVRFDTGAIETVIFREDAISILDKYINKYN